MRNYTRTEHLTAIYNAASRLRTAEDGLWTIVGNARAAGLSWQDIGKALGVTKQAAQGRFSKPPRRRLV